MNHRRHRSRLLALTLLSAISTSDLAVAAQGSAAARDERGLLGAELEALGDRARVVAIAPGGPAAAAGLQVGDVITAFNGARFRLASDRELIEGLAWLRPGRPVRISVRRQDKEREIVVIPRAANAEERAALTSWLERERAAELRDRTKRAEADFEAMARQAPIDVVFKRAAGGLQTSSKSPLPIGLELGNRIVDALTAPLAVGEQLTLRYSWDEARNALKMDVVASPPGYDVESILGRAIKRRSDPPGPPHD